MSQRSRILAARIGGIALLALAATRPALADEGYDRYQRVVLGNSSIGASESTRSPSAQVPNGVAGHLVYLGQTPVEAYAGARSAGERSSTITIAKAAPVTRTSYDTYAQVLGLSPLAVQPGSHRARGARSAPQS